MERDSQPSSLVVGIYSIKRTAKGRSRVNAANSLISSSLIPRMATALILMGKPAFSAAWIPARTLCRSPTRVISLNLSSRNESTLILRRCTPASRSGNAISSRRNPLVVRTSCRKPGIFAKPDRNGTMPFLTSGSPPVTRIFSMPSGTTDLASSMSSS